MPQNTKKVLPNQPQQSEAPKKLNKIKEKVEIATQTIDAKGKVLGRLATGIANILRGKDKPTFRPHLLMGDKVIVLNASKIKVTGDKMNQKIYYHHTGYIGNLKSETMADLYRKDPSEILRRAVKGMLPKNRLQNEWMKNLEVRNGEDK